MPIIKSARPLLGTFLGIDPGGSGGAAIVDYAGKLQDLLAFKKCTESEIYDWLRTHQKAGIERIAIEQVHSMPKQGVASSFKFGKSYGFLIGVATALRVPLVYVSPQSWQKAMKCLTKGDKNVSKTAAHRLYPEWSKVLTHAVADAALIATWCQIETIKLYKE